jgi:hypothetical protein
LFGHYPGYLRQMTQIMNHPGGQVVSMSLPNSG